MFQFDKEVLYEEAEEITKDEIAARIEANVLILIQQFAEKDNSHEFRIVDRSERNVLEEEGSSMIRLGRITKKRKISSQRSMISYSRTWKVMSIIYQLLNTGKHMTQRELFYLLVYAFDNQNQLNEIIMDVVALLHVPREMLGIYSASRGYIAGQILWNDGHGWLDCSKMGIPGKSIPGYFPHNLCINALNNRVNYILVIEKEGVFQRLLEDLFHQKFNCILITARGFPDLSSRMVVHYLKRKFNVPVLCLVDYNPFGLLILMTYKLGSIRFGMESFKYAIPDLKWVGVHGKDVRELKLLSTPLSDKDKSIKKRLLRMKFVKENEKYRKEIMEMNCKVEIQTMNNISFDFLSNNYLRNKIIRREYF